MLRRTVTAAALDKLRAASHNLTGSVADYDPLMELIGDSRIVLLGEASHGTAEYYRERARITRRLVEEKGFNFVAVEGDWPDCYEVNSYVKGRSSHRDAREVLHGFHRWPTWMWANWEIVELAEWLRQHNDGREEAGKVGFYGLDVYSLRDSMTAVVDYLDRTDRDAANRARAAYACFDPYNYGEDVEGYAWSTLYMSDSCEDEVVRILSSLRSNPAPATPDDPEAAFNAEQNALVALNAESYYRAMVR
ncbi:MAG TPA: erythromycin esterase family protein, partial [Deinococcales bacterium]|nr:erythromycin esterase family protein [Deinococcales bacterium]